MEHSEHAEDPEQRGPAPGTGVPPPLVMAVSAALGAWMAAPQVSIAIGSAAAVAAAVLFVTRARQGRARWAWLVLAGLGLFAVTGLLASRSLAGLDGVVATDWHGTATLVSDPESTRFGQTRAIVTTAEGRFLLRSGPPVVADEMSVLAAGVPVRISATMSPLSRPSDWTRSQHLRGELTVDSIETVGTASPVAAAANTIRSRLLAGAASLDADDRALLAGLVFGDDRAQPPEVTADFRAAGLTHLLAVSGQNVAFVLAVVSPGLRRLRLWPRYLVACAFVAGFAVVTRFEPSVVRASAVAAIALLATTTARPSGGLHHLGLAVTVLLVVDPLLVRSLGFRLSVAASFGVLVLAPPIVARVPGPRWIAEGLGVTVGAQLAVAPVLVPALGPMQLAAVPANIAAGPLAGATMVWGLVAGAIAAVAGGPVATVAHLPTRVLLGALEWVAALGGSLPLGEVDLRHIAVAGVVLVVGVRARSPVLRRRVVVLGTAIVVVAALITPPPRGSMAAGRAATVWTDGPVAVIDLDAYADPVEVLTALRRRRVRSVELVVVRTARSDAAEVVAAIDRRIPVHAVWTPRVGGHYEQLAARGIDVAVPVAGQRAEVAGLFVTIDRPGPPMRARIGWRDVSASGPG